MNGEFKKVKEVGSILDIFSTFEVNCFHNTMQIRAVVFRLFQKTVMLPPNSVGFRLIPNCETYVSSDMYQFAWIKHQSVL